MVHDSPSPAPDRHSVLLQLRHMLASPDFHATPPQIALLKYVVNQTLDRKDCDIKEDTVAADVFGRGSNYDKSIDPIVSIQADRLRRALVRYYENAGKNDPIRIDIPSGSFMPLFKKRKLNKS